MTIIKKIKSLVTGAVNTHEYFGFSFEKFGKEIVLELSQSINSKEIMKQWIGMVDRVTIRKGNLRNFIALSKLGKGAQGVVGKIRKLSKPLLNENHINESRTGRSIGKSSCFEGDRVYALKVISYNSISR